MAPQTGLAGPQAFGAENETSRKPRAHQKSAPQRIFPPQGETARQRRSHILQVVGAKSFLNPIRL
jgi:hypothetical protein